MMTVSVLLKWDKAAVEVVGERGFLLPVFSDYPSQVAAFAAFLKKYLKGAFYF